MHGAIVITVRVGSENDVVNLASEKDPHESHSNLLGWGC